MQEEKEPEQQQQMGERVSDLLLVNQLSYVLPPSLSVAVTRSHAAYQANQAEYSEGQTISVTMSSGGQFVNFRESYLKLTVQQIGAANTTTLPLWVAELNDIPGPDFRSGRNGVMNLFRSLRWVHASGTEIDQHVENLALWSYIKSRYTYSSDQTYNFGSTQDFETLNRDVAVFTSGGATHTFLIPLSDISDAFNQQQLCPSFLCAGSRLELRLNPWEDAFCVQTIAAGAIPVAPAVIPSSYVVSNVEIVLQQVQLTDAISRAIHNTSATSGLEYAFTSVAVTTQTNANTSGSIQLSRALSRANACFVARRSFRQVSAAVDIRSRRQTHAPSFLKIVKDGTSGQFRVMLGGQQIPQTPVRSEREAYFHMLVAMGAAFDPTRCNTVSFHDYQGVAFNELSDTVYGISLETSSTLNQSGSAVSAQRVLLFDYTDAEVDASGSSQYTMFVPHVRLASCYLDSVIVRT
jgi:hypothetical protein